jgi:hypothetical protein
MKYFFVRIKPVRNRVVYADEQVNFITKKSFYNRVSTQALQVNQALFLNCERAAIKVLFLLQIHHCSYF